MSDTTTSESQLRSAYNRVMESGLTYFWDRTPIPGVNPDDPQNWYKRAWAAFHGGDPIQAERWARAARHVATALWHEAKLAWLSRPLAQLPSLGHAQVEGEYHLHESPEDTEARLGTLLRRANQISAASDLLSDVKRLLGRARTQLDARHRPPPPEKRASPGNRPDSEDGLELIQAERLKAAHEYALCLECLVALAEGEGLTHPLPETERGGTPSPRRPQKNRGKAA